MEAAADEDGGPTYSPWGDKLQSGDAARGGVLELSDLQRHTT